MSAIGACTTSAATGTRLSAMQHSGGLEFVVAGNESIKLIGNGHDTNNESIAQREHGLARNLAELQANACRCGFL